ncbi:unnamed protein product [Peronospora destructor]|uniref:Uncharacterized protein n=1 Tax=Peronospora destructor TaxID=86335 RepID=A0AAV0UPI9_9STRA|nr:unnamed protein product [Peronospora destructor]
MRCRQTIQELEVTKTKADEEIERWKAMANLHQELVAILQIQVKALRSSDKDNLENAIALCQRSADKRLQTRTEAISLKLREFEEENVVRVVGGSGETGCCGEFKRYRPHNTLTALFIITLVKL